MNANLAKCLDCGGKVSVNANACPHCGAPNDRFQVSESAAPKTPSSGSALQRADGTGSWFVWTKMSMRDRGLAVLFAAGIALLFYIISQLIPGRGWMFVKFTIPLSVQTIWVFALAVAIMAVRTNGARLIVWVPSVLFPVFYGFFLSSMELSDIDGVLFVLLWHGVLITAAVSTVSDLLASLMDW